MDFVKLLTSLEDAVYEVMVWIMQIPKTLFRTIFQPNWAISYINAEWEKKPEERFEEYLSPVLLWLFLAVIPPILLGIDSISYLTSIIPLGEKLELQEKLAIGILFALITPLTYLSVLELINKRPATKSNLKKAFYLQCYALESVLIVMLQAFLACVVNWRYTPYFRWIMWCAHSRGLDGDNGLTIQRFVRRPSDEGALENL
jgi:hypothetical protein